MAFPNNLLREARYPAANPERLEIPAVPAGAVPERAPGGEGQAEARALLDQAAQIILDEHIAADAAIHRALDMRRLLGDAFRQFAVPNRPDLALVPVDQFQARIEQAARGNVNIPQQVAAPQGLLAEPDLWVGVGVDTTIKGAVLTASQMQRAFVDTINMEDSTAKGLLNRGQTKDNSAWFAPSVSVRLGALIMTTTTSADWRIPALKVALYDMLRENIVMQPAGVAYDMASKNMHTTIRQTRAALDVWGYSAVAISTVLLERAVRNRTIKIDGVAHYPSGDVLTFIVMDPATSNPVQQDLKVVT